MTAVLILIVIGIIIRASANSSTEYRIRYDDKCRSSALCTFDLYIREDVKGPIYFYTHYD